MPNAKNYTLYMCSTCNDGVEMDQDAVVEHLKEVHRIIDLRGKSRMLSHLDGRDWYGGTDELTLGEVTLLRNYRHERKRNDLMSF